MLQHRTDGMRKHLCLAVEQQLDAQGALAQLVEFEHQVDRHAVFFQVVEHAVGALAAGGKATTMVTGEEAIPLATTTRSASSPPSTRAPRAGAG